MSVLNSALDAVRRRAVVRVGALNVAERLVVEEPAGVDDSVEQDRRSEPRQLASYTVQVDEHARTASTAHKHGFHANTSAVILGRATQLQAKLRRIGRL